MNILNAYSFPIIAGALILIAALAYWLRTKKAGLPEFLGLGLIVAALIVGWSQLAPRGAVLPGGAGEVQAMIGQGTPVLLEFQSPYCVGCIQIKPTVDALEQEMGERLLVLRVDIQSETGRTLAPAYGFELTPTFIYFDAQGRERWREVGSLNVERVRTSVP
jgi:thioredoxin 1